MIRLFARHAGRHIPRPPCGNRGTSGSLYCTQPADHVGPHVDTNEDGSIWWPQEERLAIEAPEPEPRPARLTWRERLAGVGAALIDATERGMAWLAGHGVLEAEVRAAGLPGQCDWGDCEEPATGERWDDEYGWLPVCDYHAAPDDEPEDVPRRRPEVTAVPASGARRESEDRAAPGHPEVMQAVRVGDTYLAGSGPPIGPWCECIIGCGDSRATCPVFDCPVHGTLPPEQDEERTEIMGAIRVPAHRNVRNRWPMPPRAETHWERYTHAFGVPESLRYVAEILAAPLPQVRALTA